MKIRSFSPPHSGNQDIEELAHRILDFARPIQSCDLIGGRLIKRVEIVSGTAKTIEHGLQRVPEGWIITRKSSNSVVYEAVEPTMRALTLSATANVTVDLWVF